MNLSPSQEGDRRSESPQPIPTQGTKKQGGGRVPPHPLVVLSLVGVRGRGNRGDQKR